MVTQSSTHFCSCSIIEDLRNIHRAAVNEDGGLISRPPRRRERAEDYPLIRAINIRRGLFRAWIALSAAWSLFYFFNTIYVVQMWAEDRSYPPICNVYSCSLFVLWSERFEVIVMPWVLTAAVLCGRWAIRGFR